MAQDNFKTNASIGIETSYVSDPTASLALYGSTGVTLYDNTNGINAINYVPATGTGALTIGDTSNNTISINIAPSANFTKLDTSTNGGQFSLETATGGVPWVISNTSAALTFSIGGIAKLSIPSSTPSVFSNIAYSTSDSPIAKTAAFTVGANEKNYLVTGTASITVTLPAASSYAGREINIVNKAAFTIVSASSNVLQRASATVSTAICAGTAGSWARLVSNGTNWCIIAGA